MRPPHDPVKMPIYGVCSRAPSEAGGQRPSQQHGVVDQGILEAGGLLMTLDLLGVDCRI
jgi:hypothetical protein